MSNPNWEYEALEWEHQKLLADHRIALNLIKQIDEKSRNYGCVLCGQDTEHYEECPIEEYLNPESKF